MLKIDGVVLGYTEKPYDFQDEQGERRQGVTALLHVLDGTDKVEVKVPEALRTQAKAFAGEYANQPVELRVGVSAKIRPTLADDAFIAAGKH